MCFFASLIELLWDNGKGGTIQEQIALIYIVFIVQSIKVISLDASLPLWRQKYCVSASLSLEEAGGQWGRQWVIMSGMHIYLFTYVYTYTGFPGGARGKKPSCQWRRCKRLQVQSLGREDPLEEGMATHSSILAMDREAWQATVHKVAQSQTQHACMRTHTHIFGSLLLCMSGAVFSLTLILVLGSSVPLLTVSLGKKPSFVK